jgi:serine/threonine protein kinase
MNLQKKKRAIQHHADQIGRQAARFWVGEISRDEDTGVAESEMEPRDRALTEKGVVVGTVQYMAPEQLEGKEADKRTDIFALGEVL